MGVMEMGMVVEGDEGGMKVEEKGLEDVGGVEVGSEARGCHLVSGGVGSACRIRDLEDEEGIEAEGGEGVGMMSGDANEKVPVVIGHMKMARYAGYGVNLSGERSQHTETVGTKIRRQE